MAGNELKDFLEGFGTGFKLIDDYKERKSVQQERESVQELRGIQTQAAKAEFEEWNTDEARGLRKEAARLGNESTRAAIDVNRQNIAVSQHGLDNYEREFDLRQGQLDIQRRNAATSEREAERLSRVSDADISLTEEQARKEKYLNDRNDKAAELMKRMEKLYGVPGLLTTPGATSSGNPGPQSALPVGGARGDANSNFAALAPSVTHRLAADFGLTTEQAAGIVGQLGHESEGLQAINERNPMVAGSRGGFGWAQWTGPRRKEFEAYAARNGMNVTDPEANYAFLAHELGGREGRVLDAVRQAGDARTAGRIFTDQFLRPGIPGYASRDKWTDRALAYASDGGRETRGGGGQALAYTGESSTMDSPAQSAISFVSSGHEAVKSAAMRAADILAGDDQAVPTPDGDQQRMAILRGEGAADLDTAEEMKELAKVAGGEDVSLAEQNFLAVAIPYMAYSQLGMKDEAEAAAFQMYQHLRKEYSQWSAVAQAAAAEGDIDGAVKAAVKAYASVPNGQDIRVERTKDGNYELTVLDIESGKEIGEARQLISPDQMVAQILKLNPADVERYVADAAGVKLAEKEGAINPQMLAAIVKNNPEVAKYSPQTTTELSNVLRMLGLDENGNKRTSGSGGGGTPWAKMNPDERIGERPKIDESGQIVSPGEGLNAVVSTMLTEGVVTPSGKADPASTLWAKLGPDAPAVHKATTAIADQILAAGEFNGDPHVVVEAVLQATVGAGDYETVKVTMPDGGPGIMVNGLRLPITEAGLTMLGQARERAIRGRNAAAEAGRPKAPREAIPGKPLTGAAGQMRVIEPPAEPVVGGGRGRPGAVAVPPTLWHPELQGGRGRRSTAIPVP